jgi:hypothetical protein
MARISSRTFVIGAQFLPELIHLDVSLLVVVAPLQREGAVVGPLARVRLLALLLTNLASTSSLIYQY